MLRAALLAAGSAVLGGALALFARKRPALLERTRTFAFAAAGSVVAFHLLPDVLPGLGLRALLWMAAGFALPAALEAGAHALGPRVLHGRGLSPARAAAEVGFAALVFHSLVEGLTLWAALQAPGPHADLEIAIVAHHAPLTAAVALPFLALGGARMAGWRVFGVALAGLCGVLGGSLLPALSHQSIEALLLPAMAATAGALLHVAFDEIKPQKFSSPLERAADLLAWAAGIALAGGSALLHRGSDDNALQSLLSALARGSLEVALPLFVGLVVALAWQRMRRRERPRLERALAPDSLAMALFFFGPVLFAIRAASTAFALPLGDPGEPRPAAPEKRAPWILAGLGTSVVLAVVPTPPLSTAHFALAAVCALVLLAAAADPAAGTLVCAPFLSQTLQATHPWRAALLVAALAAGSLHSARARLDGQGLALTAAAALAAGLATLLAVDTGNTAWRWAAAIWRPDVAAVAGTLWLAFVLTCMWREGARAFLLPLRAGWHAPHDEPHQHHAGCAHDHS